MNDVIYLPKEGIVDLKKAEAKIIRLLNNIRIREFWNDLNEILALIRKVGARTKEVC